MLHDGRASDACHCKLGSKSIDVCYRTKNSDKIGLPFSCALVPYLESFGLTAPYDPEYLLDFRNKSLVGKNKLEINNLVFKTLSETLVERTNGSKYIA